MESKQNKKVMVCPLDWGLGHAARCIPIIRKLQNQGAEVILAGDGYSLNLLQREFPSLKSVHLKGYRIHFSRRLPLAWKLILLFPKIIWRIVTEHRQLSQLAEIHGVDMVISDNRYGLWSKKINSVFITHQPNIIPPPPFRFLAPILRIITRAFIRKYDQCWIPDYADENNLSGILSHGHKLPPNCKFIGPLSRFEKSAGDHLENNGDGGYDVVAIISGPEPHRSIFEKELYRQLKEMTSVSSLIVRGLPENSLQQSKLTDALSSTAVKLPYPHSVDHLTADALHYVLTCSNPVVICRGGYSTIMDMACTGNKVICIPTPGQSEQEYLALKGVLENRSLYGQPDTFNLRDCLEKVCHTKGYFSLSSGCKDDASFLSG